MTQQPYQSSGRHHFTPAAAPSWGQPAPQAFQEPQPAEDSGITPSVRGRTLDRSIQVNASHARNAADRIGTRDALGEHALILFSVDSTARPFQLSTATRLDYEEHRGEDLPAMLTSLTNHAWAQIQAAHRSGKRWDPRTPMDGLVLRSDPLTPQTEYVGLAISTLDTPVAPWHELKRSVTGADGLNLAGQGYVLLKDGSAMYFLRAAQMSGGSGQHLIVTNRPVHSIYRPTLDSELLFNASLEQTLIWQALEKLHHVLMSS